MLETDAAPKATVAPETKFVPATVTSVPPAVGPKFGVTLVTVGAGSGAHEVSPSP